MYKYFPNLQNRVDDADVTQVIDAFNEIEDDITALQNKKETDPTVPSWAKEPQKPTYTADEVGALPSDTKIPTKISDLENDLIDVDEIEELIQNEQNDRETADLALEKLIDTKIAEAKSIIPKRYLVTELPTEGIDTNGTYLVPAETPNTDNIYTEYAYINGKWEIIGSPFEVDLSNYYTKREVNSLVSDSALEVQEYCINAVKGQDDLIAQIDYKVESKADSAYVYDAEERLRVMIDDEITLEQMAREEADTALSSSLEWKLIGEAQITQEAIDEAGEDGITAITIDFGSGIDYTQWYGETLTEIIVPKSNNINSDFKSGLLHVSFGTTLESSLISSGGNRCPLVWTQSNANLCMPEWSQRILITSTWKSGRLSHSLIIYRAYSATPGYISTPCATENDISTINYITGKRFLSVSATGKNSAGTEVSCKYPAQSILRIYGRF